MIKAIIIDDENWAINYMTDLIDWNDYGVQIIKTFIKPAAAMKFLLKNNDIDVCFIDVEMPEISGIDFISKVRYKLPKVKFVLVSAYDNFKYVHKALRLGVTDYLLKPVEKNELVQVIGLFSEQKLLSETEADNKSGNTIDIQKTTGNVYELKENDVMLCIATDAPKEILLNFLDMGNSQHYKSSDKFAWFTVINRDMEKTFINRLSEFEDYSFGVYRCNGNENVSLAIINSFDAFDGCYFLERANVSVYNVAISQMLAEKIVFIKKNFENRKYNDIKLSVKSVIDGLAQQKSQASAYIQFYNQIMQILTDFRKKESQNSLYMLDIPQIKRYFENKDEFFNYFLNTIEVTCSEITQMTPLKNAKETIPQIKYFIDENFQNDLSLNKIAKKFMISEKYLSSVFKKQTGINIATYINMVRIENSKKLLANTDITIQDIAFLSGYTDFSYFARVFKKMNGVTPSNYRNQN